MGQTRRVLNRQRSAVGRPPTVFLIAITSSRRAAQLRDARELEPQAVVRAVVDRNSHGSLLGERLEQGERLLQLPGASLERLELLALAAQDAKRLFDLNLPCERDAAKVLDVLLASNLSKNAGWTELTSPRGADPLAVMSVRWASFVAA